MTEVLLFHAAHGRTAGVEEFAERVRAAGHRVHVPDLYEGQVFAELEEGIAFAQSTGFGTLLDRARRAAEPLPPEIVYAGFSLGVLPAQMLAQTRAGAQGALLLSGCIAPSEFGDGWPQDVPVQVHAMDSDPFFVEEGDLEAARALVAQAASGELFLYPGEQHLFADTSLPSYDDRAATLLSQRVLAFLAEVDRPRRGGQSSGTW